MRPSPFTLVLLAGSAAFAQPTGDERSIYPVDQRDWPVRIGHERQLFVDDYLIAERTCRRRVAQITKHPSNPVKGLVPLPFHVERAGNGWAMWCGTAAGRHLHRARSGDGVAWTLSPPRLSGVKVGGIWREPGKWVLIGNQEWPAVPREAYYKWESLDDGVTWRRRHLVAYASQEPRPTGRQGIADTSLFRREDAKYVADVKLYASWSGAGFSRLGGRYIADSRLYRMGTRYRGQMESDDLKHWTRPRVSLVAAHPREQVYAHGAFKYEGMWLGFLSVMRCYPFKQVDVELTCSRDGQTWIRVNPGEKIIPLGTADSWESDYSHGGRPVLHEGKLWVWYRGSRSKYRDESREWQFRIGLGHLRRDGFAYLEGPGTVLTRPLTMPPGNVILNATGDYSWQRTADGRLRFELGPGARLYSFWVESR